MPIVNEFAAYGKLSEYIAQGVISVNCSKTHTAVLVHEKRDLLRSYWDNGDCQKRAETIATFALCGYANPGSIGAQIGTLSAMAPDRQSDLAKVAFRAFIAGSMANFMNACVAG